MLEFTLWNDNCDKIYIKPSLIASIIETSDRKAYGGYNPIAIITMENGEKYKVYSNGNTLEKIENYELNQRILDVANTTI